MHYDIEGSVSAELFVVYNPAVANHTKVVAVPSAATVMLITSVTTHQPIWYSFNGAALVANWNRIELHKPGTQLTVIIPAGTSKIYFRKSIKRIGGYNDVIAPAIASGLPTIDKTLAYGGDTIAGIDVAFDVRN